MLLCCLLCFRPLSGNYISQYFGTEAVTGYYKFPSPVGELHFSIRIRSFYCRYPFRGFRPLSVNYISQSQVQSQWQSCRFPSPVGELHFSMSRCNILMTCTEQSFRPLSGNYISQCGIKYIKNPI